MHHAPGAQKSFNYVSYHYMKTVVFQITAARPGGFEIRRKKKVRPIKTGGFVIPQQKEKHTPLLRITNPQNLNRLGHF